MFQTNDRAEVERYCASLGIAWTWKSGNRLCTRQTGPAMIRHPRTGEDVWFNHATFFHLTTLPPALRHALLAEFGEEDLPTQTYYGDGAPIEREVLEHLRCVYRGSLRKFVWRTNDVLLVDNILTVHGRNPFRGFRRILVAMAQTFQPNDWAIRAGDAGVTSNKQTIGFRLSQQQQRLWRLREQIGVELRPVRGRLRLDGDARCPASAGGILQTGFAP